MDEQTPRPATCPHLGIADDPSTSHNFPSFWNFCFHSDPPATPDFRHQETTCLTETYLSCPVYLAAKGSAFPDKLRNKIKPVLQPPQRSRSVYAYIAGTVLLVAVAGWLVSARLINLPTARATSSLPKPGETRSVVVAMTNTAAVKTTDPLQPTAPSIPNDPINPTPTSWVPAVGENDTPAPYTLEVPFQIGGDQFLIHQVKAGEGLDYLAKIHNTTPEVIRATNYTISTPIWTDSFVVIRPGMISVDPTEPSFQPYGVTEPVTLEEIAQKLQVDLAAQKYYNACKDICTFVMGDWVLVARRK